MKLWEKSRNLMVTNKLRMGKNAVMTTDNADGTVSTIDLTELAALDSISATDLAKIDGITNGTVAAGKAVVVDANKDAGDFRNLDAVNIDAGSSGAAGTVDVFPSTASKGKLALAAVDNDGDTATTISNAAMGQASVVSIPDPGAATANFVLTDAANDGVLVTATAAEVNRACDVTGRVVDLDATSLAVTEALHEGRVITLSHTAAESTVTLPEATGSGARYRFIVAAVNTNNHKITTADAANASFYGSVNLLDLDAAAQTAYAPAATDELITLNGTTTGGQIGDYIELIDMATDKWMVFGQLQCPTGSNPATPFSGA